MTQAILNAGLITPEQLAELQRWKTVNVEHVDDVTEPTSLETAATMIETALQEQGYVVMRQTDLEALHRYLESSAAGRLVVSVGDQHTAIDVFYGRGLMGEYILPWRSEAITEALIEHNAHLETADGPVAFLNVRELFYGDRKALLVCEGVT